jgi:hypothetical protein
LKLFVNDVVAGSGQRTNLNEREPPILRIGPWPAQIDGPGADRDLSRRRVQDD